MSKNSRDVSNETYTRKPERRGKALTFERAFEIDNTKGTDVELAEKFQCSIATVKKAHSYAAMIRPFFKRVNWN